MRPVKTNTVIIATKLIAVRKTFNQGLSNTLDDNLVSVNGVAGADELIPTVINDLYYFINGTIRVGIGKSIRKMTNMKNMNNTKKAKGIIIR